MLVLKSSSSDVNVSITSGYNFGKMHYKDSAVNLMLYNTLQFKNSGLQCHLLSVGITSLENRCSILLSVEMAGCDSSSDSSCKSISSFKYLN